MVLQIGGAAFALDPDDTASLMALLGRSNDARMLLVLLGNCAPVEWKGGGYRRLPPRPAPETLNGWALGGPYVLDPPGRENEG